MKWSDLTFEGYDTRLRRTMTAAESMIHCLGSLHENDGYPNKSAMPEPKMCACECPTAECLELKYVFDVPGCRSSFCRAPAYFVPRVVGEFSNSETCTNRAEHKHEAHKAQTSPSEGGRSVSLGKTASIKGWMRSTLQKLAQDEKYAAAANAYLHDTDTSLTMQQLHDLGEEMARRCDEEKPWEVIAK